MRVSQGGHDVPTDKLWARYPRTLANLTRAVRQLPCVLVYDNGDLSHPYRQVAVIEEQQVTWKAERSRTGSSQPWQG